MFDFLIILLAIYFFTKIDINFILNDNEIIIQKDSCDFLPDSFQIKKKEKK